MQISLMEIRGLLHPLQKLASQDLPIKTSWKVLMISEQVERINQKIEEFRQNLIYKHGEKVFAVTLSETNEQKILNEAEYENADKSLFSSVQSKVEVLEENNLKTFMRELDELLKTKENLHITEVLSIDELPENIKITPQELFFLKILFTE